MNAALISLYISIGVVVGIVGASEQANSPLLAFAYFFGAGALWPVFIIVIFATRGE